MAIKVGLIAAPFCPTTLDPATISSVKRSAHNAPAPAKKKTKPKKPPTRRIKMVEELEPLQNHLEVAAAAAPAAARAAAAAASSSAAVGGKRGRGGSGRGGGRPAKARKGDALSTAQR